MKRVNTSIKPMSKDHGSVNVSIRDMVLLAATLAGWAFNYATLSSRVNADEKAIIDLQQRYEKEVVPRTEHVEMNRRLDERLGRIETDIGEIKLQFSRQDVRRQP